MSEEKLILLGLAGIVGYLYYINNKGEEVVVIQDVVKEKKTEGDKFEANQPTEYYGQYGRALGQAGILAGLSTGYMLYRPAVRFVNQRMPTL